MQEIGSLLWAFVWWQTALSQLLWVLSTSWLLLFLSFCCLCPWWDITPPPRQGPYGMASTPLRVLSWQWVENYSETSLGNAYSTPIACWLWFWGLLLTAVVLKEKMKRKAYLTTANWHGQQRPNVEVGASAGPWGVGWFGLFTPKDVGGPLRLVGENESKFWDRTIHQVCREQWVNQSDANNCTVCFVIV